MCHCIYLKNYLQILFQIKSKYNKKSYSKWQNFCFNTLCQGLLSTYNGIIVPDNI